MKRTDHSDETLAGLLEKQAGLRAEEVAVVVDNREYTWSWIYTRSRSFAFQLEADGVTPGTPVVIRVPNSIEFLIAFYGTLISGAIPVPVFPQAGWARCARIMNLCGGKDLVVAAPRIAKMKKEAGPYAAAMSVRWHRVDENLHVKALVSSAVSESGDTALIQYTSGSTGFPKGVMLTNQQLLTNIRQMTGALNITAKDIFVSWLPAHHDMGLILCILVPLYTGAKLVLLTNGLRKPHTWMEAIETYRATITAAPDIAFRICVKAVRDPGRYDLSSLRVALNAAEPIRETTIRSFEDHFGIKNVVTTGYGLAEASVAVTIHHPGLPLIIDHAGHVSSGQPLKDIRIRIVSGKKVLPIGMPGEIQVNSPACMKGYFRGRRRIFTDDGYLPTGDIGYLDHLGNLFVLGRKKNVIKQGAQTIYADDLEEVAGTIEGVRRVAALGVTHAGTGMEQLLIMAEYSRNSISPDEGYRLVTNMVERIHSHFGQRPARIFLLRPKSIPLTPNGKQRYSHLKDVYLNQQERFRKLILYT